MKQIQLTLILFCLFAQTIFAQKEGYNWFFGSGAGLSFQTTPPTFVAGSPINTPEGCSAISDAEGNLLFYTDGMSVWNKNHTAMPNGTGLYGNFSSTQSGVIIPFPNSSTKYYVFTVEQTGNINGLCYSIVDMTLNGGLGDVTTKNIQLHTPSTEKITAVKHATLNAYWVITHPLNTNAFYVYLIDNNGVNHNPVVTSIGRIHEQALGYLKASPDGSKIGIARQGGGVDGFVEIFDFNNLNGTLSNPITFINQSQAYGLEFSADSKKMYFTTLARGTRIAVNQVDLSLPTNTQIFNSLLKIDSVRCPVRGALQLAPDRKIYIAKSNSTYLGVIHQPELAGTACGVQDSAVFFGTALCKNGLPTFIQSYFLPYNQIVINQTCIEYPINFSLDNTLNVASVLWLFGDGTSSTELAPAHIYTSAGTFTVQVTVNYTNGAIQNFTKEIIIYEKNEIHIIQAN